MNLYMQLTDMATVVYISAVYDMYNTVLNVSL